MKIVLKCFASLASHLPPHAQRNAAQVEMTDGMSVNDIIDHYHIDREDAHLVILNGVFICCEDRDNIKLKEGDTLALWPEVAGG